VLKGKAPSRGKLGEHLRVDRKTRSGLRERNRAAQSVEREPNLGQESATITEQETEMKK
jgi:hypothetical protein